MFRRLTLARIVVPLAAGALLLLAVAHAPPTRVFVRSRVVAWLAGQGLVARIEGLDYNLLTLKVGVARAALASAHTPGQPFAEVEALRADLPWSAVTGSMRLESLEAARLRIALKRAEGGGWNLPEGEGGPATATSLPIGRLRIAALDVAVDDREGGLGLDLTGARVELSGGAGIVRGPIFLPSLVPVSAAGRCFALRDPKLRLRYDGTNLDIETLTAAVAGGAGPTPPGDAGEIPRSVSAPSVRAPLAGARDAGTLEMRGRIASVLGEVALALEGEARVDVEATARLVGLADPPSGSVKAAFRIDGPASDPHIALDATAPVLRVQGVEVRDASVSAEVTSREAVAKDVRLDVAGGVATARLRLALAEDAGRSEAGAEWHDLRLGELAQLAGGALRVRPAGMATGRLAATWGSVLPSLDLTAVVDFTAADAPAGSVAVEGRIRVGARGGRWNLDHDVRSGTALAVTGRHGGDLRATLADSTLDGEASVAVPDVRILAKEAGRAGFALPADVIARAEGGLRGTARVSGTLAAPAFAAQLAGERLAFGTLGSGVAGVAVRGDASHVTVERASVDLDHLHASIAGDVRFDGDRLALKFAAASDDVKALAGAVPGLEDAGLGAGTLSLDGTVTGTTSRPVVEAVAEARGVEAARQRIASARGRIGASPDAVQIDGLELRQCAPEREPPCQAGGVLRVDARYALRTRRVAVRAEGHGVSVMPVPAGVVSTEPIPLAVDVSSLAVDVAGPIDGLVGRVVADLSGASWDGYQAGPARLEANLDGAAAVLTASAPRLGVTARGRVEQRTPWPFTADVELNTEDASALAGGLFDVPADVALSLATSLHATGDLAAPERVAGSLTLARLTGSGKGVPIALASPTRVEWRDGMLTLSETAATIGGLTLRAGGTLSERDSRLQASVRGDLADVAPLVALSGVTALAGASGGIDGRLDVTGSAARPQVTGRLEVREGLARIEELPEITGVALRAQLADGRVSLEEATAQWQGGVASVRGELPLRALSGVVSADWLDRLSGATGPAKLSATFDSLTARLAEPFLSPEVAKNLSARLSGAVEIESDDLTLPRTRGALTLKDASFAFSGIPLEQTRPARFTLADGRIRAATAEFSSGANRLFLAGGVTLGDPRGPRFDVAADATLDLRVISAFLPEIASAGTADISVSLGGPVSAPDIGGQVVIKDGQLRIPEPRVAITNVDGTVLLTGGELHVDRMSGLANGGDVSLSGTARLEGFELASARFLAKGSGIALAYPSGLRTESDGEVTLSIEGPAQPPRLSGKVVVQRGAYRDPLSLFALARYAATPTAPTAEPTLLDRMRLDVAVTSGEDLVFDNNYGRFEAGIDVVAGGTFLVPTMTGRVALREGGQVYLGGNTLIIDRGAVNFAPSTRIAPDLDIVTRTRVGQYDLSVTLSGPPEELKVDLSSESHPGLSDADIASLLVSGQTAGVTAESQMAREQVIGLFSGELLSLAGRAVGLDSVRVSRGSTAQDLRFDPSLVATEVNPAARITVSKRLGSDVEVVASRSLRESGNLTWIVGYSPRGLFEVRAIVRDDNARTYEFTQERTFGRGARPRARARTEQAKPRVAEVIFEGSLGLDEGELRGRIRVRQGDEFDFHRWQRDRDRLLVRYHDRGFLEATVDARREAAAGEAGQPRVVLRYAIKSGPRTEIAVHGAKLPRDVMRAMRETWTTSVFDGFLTDDLAERSRLALVRRGYVRATAEARIETSGDGQVKQAVIDIEPGERFRSRHVEYQDNDTVSRRTLEDVLKLADLRERVWIDPAPAITALRDACVRTGFLDAAVEALGPVFDGGTATLTFRISEGRRYALELAALVGTAALADADVRKAAQAEAGTAYTPESLDGLLRRAESFYRRQGFNAVQIEARQAVNRAAAKVDVTLAIVEGPRQVLAGIDVEGADRTHPRIVARALDLDIGAPANLEDWARAQRRLYDAGVFRLADIEPEPSGPALPSATGSGLEQPVRAKVRLEEWPSLRVRYGVLLSDSPGVETETRNLAPGLVAELQQRNLFGRTASAGLAGRYEKDFRVGRAYVAAPRLFGLPLLSSAYVAFQRRVVSEDDYANSRQTAGAEQRLRLGFPLEVSWNVSLERSRVYDLHPQPDDPFALDATITLARVATAAAYDKRDDPFDTTRGWLHTASVEYSAVALGDESLFGGARFIKYTGQQFLFLPVWRGIVLASAARVGLANGLGQDVVFSERFLLGGSTTVRGYADLSLGPHDVFGIAEGGEAMIVLNQEVRFPIYGWLRGVTFVDAGNVFTKPRDFNLGQLDLGAGLGARLATPFALIRIDYAVPFSRGFGRRDARWYFSIGQAF